MNLSHAATFILCREACHRESSSEAAAQGEASAYSVFVVLVGRVGVASVALLFLFVLFFVVGHSEKSNTASKEYYSRPVSIRNKNASTQSNRKHCAPMHAVVFVGLRDSHIFLLHPDLGSTL